MKESLSACEACGIDTKEGIERFMDQEALFLKFLLRFLEDDGMQQLVDSFEKKEVEDCFHAAHSLKALTGNLAITCMYEPLKPLVEILRSGQLPEEEDVFTLKQKYEQVIATLQCIKEKNVI